MIEICPILNEIWLYMLWQKHPWSHNYNNITFPCKQTRIKHKKMKKFILTQFDFPASFILNTVELRLLELPIILNFVLLKK